MHKKKVEPHPVLRDFYTESEYRQQKVNDMFDSAALHYDWITDVMSFGSGRWYRRKALTNAGCRKGFRVLDVGAGTGVITGIAQHIVGPTGEAIALDPSKNMLLEAEKNGVRKVVQGHAEALPFEDNSFDLLTMGYALRHVDDLSKTFSEFLRVLKPSGKVLILEISRPEKAFSAFFLKLYLKFVVPNFAYFGRRGADSKVLMQYYWETIENCVPPAVILESLGDAGFSLPARRVELGIFSEYSGLKG